jgi:hypothetical protein
MGQAKRRNGPNMTAEITQRLKSLEDDNPQAEENWLPI